jgi:hypothetical protein
MTLRIEQTSDGQTTTLRLIGQFQSEHLEVVKEPMKDGGPSTVLDLDEVTLVDVHVVRFLGRCERKELHSSTAHPISASGSRGSRGSGEQTESRRAKMTELLDLALQAHGGLERRRETQTLLWVATLAS